MRYGRMAPLAIEKKFINEIVDRDSEPCALGVPINGGMLTIIKTKMSAEQVAEEYRVIQEQANTQLPIIVFEVGAEGTGFSLDAFPMVRKLLDIFKVDEELKAHSVEKEVCYLTLDQLLDLVSQKGVENLSTKELSRLKELSKNK